uniref:Uncharacterized protein n=1 Tax=Biomphalaria glabrata TaxID=6526 RepID=A0A2C9KLL6_BIOGL
MSWKVKKGDNEGSGSKKRKLDAVGADNDWDDDIGFTQDELEKIDVIASQAILQSQSYNTEGTAIAPPLNPFASSTTTSRNSSSSALKESQLLLTSSSRSNNDRISSNGRTSQTKLEQESSSQSIVNKTEPVTHSPASMDSHMRLLNPSA